MSLAAFPSITYVKIDDQRVKPRLGGVLAIILCLSIWITWDAIRDIIHIAATESEASHIWLVPFMFAWLAWMRRRQICNFPSGTSWAGAITLAIGLAFWIAGYRLQVQSAWHFGAILFIAGGVIAIAGDHYLFNFLPAWGALLFSVPIPIRLRMLIAQPLERLTAGTAQSLCDVLGMSVGRSGNQLSVNGVDVCVAEACNGVRLIFTLFFACYVAVFIRQYRPWLRIVILALSPVVAVSANVIRLVPTLWVYGHYPSSVAEHFHDISGAVMVVVAFLTLTGVCILLQWVGFQVLDGNVNADVFILQRKIESPPQHSRRRALSVVTLILCTGASQRLTLPDPTAAGNYHSKVAAVAALIPISNDDWSGVEIPLPQASLDALKPNVAISRRYQNRKTGRSLDLLILQTTDIRDLVPHYPPVCYPGQGLILSGSAVVTLAWPGTTVTARRYSFDWHDFRRGEPTVVDNFMVLPTGQTQPDTAGMERRIGTDRRYFGCAQVQVVYREILSPQEQTSMTESVLNPYLPLLNTIMAGGLK